MKPCLRGEEGSIFSSLSWSLPWALRPVSISINVSFRQQRDAVGGAYLSRALID
jgi:hypothetical protein